MELEEIKEKLKKYQKDIDEMKKIHNKKANFFKILKVEEYENRHSVFLSWLFDINASHGLGKKFLELFFKNAFIDDCNIDFNAIDSVSVRTEVMTKNKKRIDILIVDDSNKITCTIENKYGSFVHGGQCADYREYIEGRKNKYEEPKEGEYPVSDGWKNYFVFLDISKPKDFDNKEIYADYNFISYENVKDILNNLVENGVKNTTQIFIKQYIEILGEKYDLPPVIKKHCDEIRNEEIKKIVDLYYEDEFSQLDESKKIFIKTIKDYYDINKRDNDKNIYKILKNIIKDENRIISSYGSGRNPKDGVSYAYAINVEDVIVQEHPFIKSVDFTAIDGLCIDIYVGLTPKGSLKFVEFINEAPDKFLKKLQDLKDNKWNCELSYRICGPNSYLNKGVKADIIINIEDILKNKELIQERYVKWQNKKNDDKVGMINVVKDYLDILMEEYGYVDPERTKEKIKKDINIISEKGNGITAGYCLKLRFALGEYMITDDNIDDIKNIYIDKTLEGLSLFNIKENEKIFK